METLYRKVAVSERKPAVDKRVIGIADGKEVSTVSLGENGYWYSHEWSSECDQPEFWLEEIVIEQKVAWIAYSKQLPPEGIEVIAYNEAWIDEDFNPRGIRIGFKTDEDFITAHYWNYQDTYMTVSHADCDNNEVYSEKIRMNIEPTHWKEIESKDPTSQLKADKEELLEALENLIEDEQLSSEAMETEIKSLIQKHKQ